MVARANTPIFLQAVILILLIMSIPYALTFTPYINTDPFTPYYSDSLYQDRATLIIGGMIAGILSLFVLFFEIVREGFKGVWNVSNLFLQTSMAICSLTIGWMYYPYWANGVSQALSAKTLLYYIEPDKLIPMIWVGKMWYIVVLLTSYAAWSVGLALLIMSVHSIKRRKPGTWKYIATFLIMIMTYGLYFSDMNYVLWMSD